MSTAIASSPDPAPGAARRPGRMARALFAIMDVVYGKATSLEKFAALELVARVPYQAWQNVAYVAITHLQGRSRWACRVFEFVLEARAAQDNEQWHLLALEELLAASGARRGWWRARAIPQLLALVYYHTSWLLYVLWPRLSYQLNADFEDHAERAYLAHAAAHPELDDEPYRSELSDGRGPVATVGDLLRRIAADEREHRDHSLAHLAAPRFGELPVSAATG